jgi:hypothetical protein
VKTPDGNSALYSRVFKSLMLSEDIAAREEAGQLLRPEGAQPRAPLFGEFEAYFSRDLRDRAERMTYAYSLFFCFENAVRDLVAQRLTERKGAGWWAVAVPTNGRGYIGIGRGVAEEDGGNWMESTVKCNGG